MFANDCMNFYKENRKAARHYNVALENYCSVLGQFSKFLKGTGNRKEQDIDDILHVPSSNGIGTYLCCNNIDHERTGATLLKLRNKLAINWVFESSNSFTSR